MKTCPGKTYIICSTPRAGNQLLCRSLSSLGIAGKPADFFVPHVRDYKKNPHLIKYIQKLFDETATPNGVFGCDIKWHSLKSFEQEYFPSTGNILAELFQNPKYIFLTRRNKLRQAISFEKAHQENVWYETAGGEKGHADHLHAAERLRFDFDRINKAKERVARHENCWNQFFKERNIRPLCLDYESFVSHYKETLLNILSFLDIREDGQFNFPTMPLVKQASWINDQWFLQYQIKNFFKGRSNH